MQEPVDYGEMRRKIHEALAQAIAEEETEDTILSGWNLIYEGIHPNHKKSLTYITSDATGDQPLTPWAAKSYMDYIIQMFGNGEEEQDDDE